MRQFHYLKGYTYHYNKRLDNTRIYHQMHQQIENTPLNADELSNTCTCIMPNNEWNLKDHEKGFII